MRKLTPDQARAMSAARSSHAPGSGRRRVKDRCPCGRFTRQRAQKRGHRC
jgi:hypothetical protein